MVVVFPQSLHIFVIGEVTRELVWKSKGFHIPCDGFFGRMVCETTVPQVCLFRYSFYHFTEILDTHWLIRVLVLGSLVTSFEIALYW